MRPGDHRQAEMLVAESAPPAPVVHLSAAFRRQAIKLRAYSQSRCAVGSQPFGTLIASKVRLCR